MYGGGGTNGFFSRTSSTTLSISTSSSHQNLVPVTSKLAFREKRWWKKRLFVVPLIVLLTLVVSLVIALVVVSLDSRKSINICDSTQCIRSAANLIQSMDTSFDPCEDFYMFACGNWGREHPIPESAVSNDWFNEKNNHMMRKIKNYFQSEEIENEPKPVRQARILYHSCIDTDTIEKLGLEPILNVLDSLGLPKKPPISNIPLNTDWIRVVAKAKVMMYYDIIIGFGVIPDAMNRYVNRLTVTRPDFNSPIPGYHDLEQLIKRHKQQTGAGADTSTETLAFKEYVRGVMKILLESDPAGSSNVPAQDLDDAIDLLTAFLGDVNDISASTRLNDDEAVELTVTQLQDLTDASARRGQGLTRINWEKYFLALFENIENITLDLHGKDKIIVFNMEYFKAISSLLSNTATHTLELVMWWYVVHTLSPTASRNMRTLTETYLEKISGGKVPQSRATLCTKVVIQMMDMAVTYFLVDPQFFNSTRKKVEEMIDNIKWAFKSLVMELNWMDDRTKEATLEKSAAMQSQIGYPEWLMYADELEEYYDDIEVHHDKYLINLIGFISRSAKIMLSALHTPNSNASWLANPTEVNAYYTFSSNLVSVPFGILRFPFYDLGLEVLNYGAIGSILGHEVTHGFDDSGRKYDKEGNVRQWWSNTTVEEYLNRTSCFVNQYSSYKLEEINATISGRLTLGENIADNGGIREAFRAYQKFQNRHGKEPKLPGLEAYSHEQLFFLTFANVWCESWTEHSLYWSLDDTHAPNRLRVHGALSNSPEFSDAWNCPSTSVMNRKDKCRLW